MTLLYVKHGDNAAERCDAKCYNAITPHCDCCCGGKNHGVGFKQAVENVRDMFGPITDVLLDCGGIQI